MGKDEIGQALSKIEELTGTMLSTPEDDRILVFRAIDSIILALEAELRRSPKPVALQKLQGLKVDLIAMARLDDPDGHSDEEHYEWAMKAIADLRAPLCFGAKA